MSTATNLKRLRDLVAENPIRKWRDENDVTQTEAAVLLGVSSMTIGNWEYGSTDPNEENHATIERVIGQGTVAKIAAWKQRVAKRLAA